MLQYIFDALEEQMIPETRRIRGITEDMSGQVKEIALGAFEESLREIYQSGNLDDLMHLILNPREKVDSGNTAAILMYATLRNHLRDRLGIKEDDADNLTSYMLPVLLDLISDRLVKSRYSNDPGGLLELLELNNDTDFMAGIEANHSRESLLRFGMDHLFSTI